MLFTWFLGEPVIKGAENMEYFGRAFPEREPDRDPARLRLRYGTFADGTHSGEISGFIPRFTSRPCSLWNVGLFVGRTGRLHRFDFDTGYEVVTIYNHLKAAQNTFWEIDQAVERSKKKERKQQRSK